MNAKLINMFYVVLPNVVKASLMAVVSLILAKIYGAEDFGYFSYSLAVLYLLNSVCRLGLNTVLPKHLIENPKQAKHLALIAAACILFMNIVSYGSLIFFGDYFELSPKLYTLILISCTAIFFLGTDVLVWWQQSFHENKSAGIIRSTVFTLGSIVKIVLALLHTPIEYIAAIGILESMIFSIYFSRWFLKNKSCQSEQAFNFDLKPIFSLIKHAQIAFYIGICQILFSRIDIFMLEGLSSVQQLATYSLVSKISEILFFIAASTSTVMLPLLSEKLHQRKSEEYNNISQSYATFMFYLSIATSLGILVTMWVLFTYMFQAEYPAALDIGIIHCWANIPHFLMVATSVYLISQNKFKTALIRSGLALGLNIVLNIYWIPTYGALGATYATLASYLFMLLIPMFNTSFRNFIIKEIQLKALHPKLAIQFIKKI